MSTANLQRAALREVDAGGGSGQAEGAAAQTIDLSKTSLRELNARLQSQNEGANQTIWEVTDPRGMHAVAVGLDAPLTVNVRGSVGYYGAGMNKKATVVIHGSAGPGVAENMMSGQVIVKGDASQYAGATGHGGLLLIEGNASSRCGISMKGIDIVVKGNIGHMSAFMAQSGNLVVLGDAGDALGDSIYEARLFVRGKVKSLGADCIEKEMRPEHHKLLGELLKQAGIDGVSTSEFKRYGSARKLYNFNIDNADAY
jgi:glutamate synthase domain-containing protein 3